MTDGAFCFVREFILCLSERTKKMGAVKKIFRLTPRCRLFILELLGTLCESNHLAHVEISSVEWGGQGGMYAGHVDVSECLV
jgi:hypothetical protein